MDDSLELLKQKRFLEIMQRQQEQMAAKIDEEQKLATQIAQLEIAVKSAMTNEAIARYGNLKLAHPKKAISALIVMAQMLQTGNFSKIDDAQLKQILINLDNIKYKK